MTRTLPHIALLLALSLFLASAPPVALSASHEVFSAADSGPGTLRQALLNAGSGDTIFFRASVFGTSNPPTIFVRSALPSLTDGNVTIDASNVNVILDGSPAPNGTNGLIVNSDNCVIRGLTIKNFPGNGIIVIPGGAGNRIGGDRSLGSGPNGQGNLIIATGGSGVEIRGPGADGNLVQGNYIGIERTGQFELGNDYNGVAIWKGARGNTVGGSAPGLRNLISGNKQNGVWIGDAGTNGNLVTGNYIGTTADGRGSVGNHLSGVSIQGGAQANRIVGNLISGNHDNGIYMSDRGTERNSVLGNIIGPDSLGTGRIGHLLNGVILTRGASNNAIGDGTLLGRNIISNNAYEGVLIEGADTAGNTVRGNIVGANRSGHVGRGLRLRRSHIAVSDN